MTATDKISDIGRLSKWKTNHYFPRTFVGGDLHPKLHEVTQDTSEKPCFGERQEEKPFSVGNIIRSSKELIYARDNDQQFVYFIVHTIDASNAQPCISLLMHTLEIEDEDVIEFLAIAHVEEVPVFPNTRDDEEALLLLYSRLYKEGFLMNYKGDGNTKKRFRLTEKVRAPTTSLEEGNFVSSLDFSRLHPPALTIAARKYLEIRENEFLKSQKFVNELELAISELERLVCSVDHREDDLQRCLQKNPILFGVEYRRITNKPALGSDYQLDFALENWNGEIHILEIEMSNKNLFTNKLRPTRDLVHAEQQVLDWIEWIRQYPNYAESKIPYIRRSYGTIIIGRNKDTESQSIKQRNRTFRGILEILTYDDLIDKAKHLLRRIIDR